MNDKARKQARKEIADIMQIPPHFLEPRPEPRPDAPVFSECVVGYRDWVVDPLGQLRAITMVKQAWSPGVNTASCRPNDQDPSAGPFAAFAAQLSRAQMATYYGHHGARASEAHRAPVDDCHCGLYAWNDFPSKERDWSKVDGVGQVRILGSIAAWGDLRVHATGFRAEHACVTALAWHETMSARLRATVERVADEYRVPAVHVDTLQAEAERHGTPLPADVRPQQRNPYDEVHTWLMGAPVLASGVVYTTRPPVQVFALSRRQAEDWAQAAGMRRDEWQFVEDARGLLGFAPRDIVIVGRAESRPDWPDFCRALALNGARPTDVRRESPGPARHPDRDRRRGWRWS